MHRFQTTLVSGRKRPYSSWTFLIVPPELAADWGPGQKAVRGTLAGHPFRGTASRGEGALRVPIPRDLREQTGLRRGDTVEVALELDSSPPPVPLPDELRAVFRDDPEIAALYDELPPSHRRAWPRTWRRPSDLRPDYTVCIDCGVPLVESPAEPNEHPAEVPEHLARP